MQIRIKQSGNTWHIYINGLKYYKPFVSEHLAINSDDYKHFNNLIQGINNKNMAKMG